MSPKGFVIKRFKTNKEKIVSDMKNRKTGKASQLILKPSIHYLDPKTNKWEVQKGYINTDAKHTHTNHFKIEHRDTF